MKSKLVYLGFVISKDGLKMDPKKIEAIVNWPSPKNIFEVRSCHGLAKFYRKFIRNFNGICAPILKTRRIGSYFNGHQHLKGVFNC